jgi:hypothetical protein
VKEKRSGAAESRPIDTVPEDANAVNSATSTSDDPQDSPGAREVADDLVFDEIQDLAEKATSYWLSVREAVLRHEPIAVAVPLRQVRLVTKDVVRRR